MVHKALFSTTAEFDPVFKDNPNNPNEGIVDVTITIDEGKQFTLRRLEFSGNTFTRDKVMRREFLLNEGDIYNQNFLDISVARLNQTQYFDPVDKDQDVEIRTDEEKGDVDLIVKVKEKGRQQISFNGGVSGIGGSFFGLEYSTNNLAGRGEVFLSTQVPVIVSRVCSSVTRNHISATDRSRSVFRFLPAATGSSARARS